MNFNEDYVVYMGAYNIDTWIKKILNKEIELPKYQRDFVWQWEPDGTIFLETIKEGLYIPSVTLAEYDGKTWLIDGQQRLTSIICLFYGVWPIFPESSKENNNSSETEDESPSLSTPFTFKEIQDAYQEDRDSFISNLLKNGKLAKKEGQIEGIVNENKINIFIPYSLIMWKNKNKKNQQEFLAKTFQRINSAGISLKPKEIRQALYWIHGDSFAEIMYYKDFESKIKIRSNKGPSELDFAGYLAIWACADYTKALKYSSRTNIPVFEKYIDNFISFLKGKVSAGKSENSNWQPWSDSSNEKISSITMENYKELRRVFAEIFGETYIFDNITQADYTFFGLINMVYNHQSINTQKKDIIKEEIKNIVAKKYKDPLYNANPNALVRIRLRISESIELWKKFEK